MRKPKTKRIEEAKYHNPEKQKTKTAQNLHNQQLINWLFSEDLAPHFVVVIDSLISNNARGGDDPPTNKIYKSLEDDEIILNIVLFEACCSYDIHSISCDFSPIFLCLFILCMFELQL